MFQALYLHKDAGGFSAALRELPPLEPGEGEVLVRIEYSTLNFKDGLAITDRAPVVRSFPMVPGIDGAGTVLISRHPDWKPGDRVVSTGADVGELRWGCLAQQAVLPPDGMVKLPDGFSARHAMAVGTAGFTAALAVLALERYGLPPGGEVLVTGATGGVGSIAVALLARAGHRVTALTGKPAEADYLRELGAADILDRATLAAPGRPLQKERWDGVVDALGSHTLVNALAQTKRDGVVAACGLAQGGDLPGTVMPFILRNVTLAGINSVWPARPLREAAWQRIFEALDTTLLDRLTQEISLAQAQEGARALMEGRVRGRIVVRIDA
ncbi:MDR family oxidoreductase [Azohydromonas caseinilytica]|uniref:Oxidoreductase n=1 Tax=Azohydromonas caseinilytica TaxID=2728836 RepID=A0A848F9H3_9BURK|nr:MDR family oxidoreductase [Azohydromonas caseinilytica]NML15375.1 oxidoreductase [Azohydromonas caseinilytica]